MYFKKSEIKKIYREWVSVYANRFPSFYGEKVKKVFELEDILVEHYKFLIKTALSIYDEMNANRKIKFFKDGKVSYKPPLEFHKVIVIKEVKYKVKTYDFGTIDIGLTFDSKREIIYFLLIDIISSIIYDKFCRKESMR